MASAEAGIYFHFPRIPRQLPERSDSSIIRWRLSRLDTDNDRPNNQYRFSNVIANIGWSPNEQLRISSLFTYSLADTGNPNTIFDPKPFDNF